MTTYEPGTVAMVTFEGVRWKAIRYNGSGWWTLVNKGAGSWLVQPEADLSDITPLPVGEPGQVFITADRSTTDLLLAVDLLAFNGDEMPRCRETLSDIIDAIREQTSEPPRWTVEGLRLLDKGVPFHDFFLVGDAQAAAAALNRESNR